MKKAVLSLGTNLGNREENLSNAVDALKKLPGTTVISVSRFYETAPVEVSGPQNRYLNCCVQILTEFTPKVLLGACLGIEAAMGRERTEYHGSRIIDLDLLLYEGVEWNDKELSLPHPRMIKRGFVLIPLNDLFSDKKALGLDFSSAFEKVSEEDVTLFERK